MLLDSTELTSYRFVLPLFVLWFHRRELIDIYFFLISVGSSTNSLLPRQAEQLCSTTLRAGLALDRPIWYWEPRKLLCLVDSLDLIWRM